MNPLQTIKRNFRPIVAITLPLVLIVLAQAGNLLAARPDDPPPGVSLAHWNLYRDGIKIVMETTATLAFGLVGAILAIFDHNDKLSDHLASIPASTICKLRSGSEALDEMATRIAAARKQIYLMYLRSNPVYDDETKAYWVRMTESLVKIKSAIPVRRVASIDSAQKLRFLLKNNKDIFDKGGEDLGGLDYKLVVFPSVTLKPLQWDIVDEALFLFTPRAEKKTLLVTDHDIIDNYVDHFKTLIAGIEQWTLLSTSGKLARPSKATCGYSLDEIKNIIRTMKYILRLKPSELTQSLFTEYICDYCEDTTCNADWFTKEYEHTQAWPDLLGVGPLRRVS